MEAFLRDPSRLATVEQHLAAGKGSATQKKVLAVFIRTFGCYQMKDQDAVTLRSECTKVEDSLSAARNSMKLGYYTDATKGTFVEKSSVGLRTTMKTAENEADRKAAWEGLRSIGPFVLENGFVELLKNRNKMAKKLGYVDFYDYKVTQAEGFGKVSYRVVLSASGGIAPYNNSLGSHRCYADVRSTNDFDVIDVNFNRSSCLRFWTRCCKGRSRSWRGPANGLLPKRARVRSTRGTRGTLPSPLWSTLFSTSILLCVSFACYYASDMCGFLSTCAT